MKRLEFSLACFFKRNSEFCLCNVHRQFTTAFSPGQRHPKQVYLDVTHWCYSPVSVKTIGLTPQVNLDLLQACSVYCCVDVFPSSTSPTCVRGFLQHHTHTELSKGLYIWLQSWYFLSTVLPRLSEMQDKCVECWAPWKRRLGEFLSFFAWPSETICGHLLLQIKQFPICNNFI